MSNFPVSLPPSTPTAATMADKNLDDVDGAGLKHSELLERLILDVAGLGAKVGIDGNSTGIVAEALAHKYLKPTGCWETLPRTSGFADQAPLSSGRVSLVAIALPKDLLVTNVAFHSLTTAASAPTHWWFSLCDSSYVTLRSTANQTTTAWAANTRKNVALSSPFTTAYEGLYYLAIMMAATTPISAVAATQNTAAVNALLPLPALHGLTGQTTAPSDGTNLAPSPTAQNPMMYATVS